MAVIIGPTPPGTGVMLRRGGRGRRRVDATTQPVVRTMDADIDDDGPGYDLAGSY